MAIVLVQEFADAGRSDYETVMDKLGLGIGDDRGWPDGMITHDAAETEDGFLLLVDRWKSMARFDTFRIERLSPAIIRAGLQSQPRVVSAEVFNTYPAS